MSNDPGQRTYNRSESVVFLKTKEAFGGLSNMAGGYPLTVNGVRILTAEALYQACRFPYLPNIQRLIIEQNSPMTAKMKSKPYRKDSREDWDRIRIPVMRWCLRVKLVQHWEQFSRLLLSTAPFPIVEESRKDDFWGAKPGDFETLTGRNVLGRLLMELRGEMVECLAAETQMKRVDPPGIPDFLLYGAPIEPVEVQVNDGPVREISLPTEVAVIPPVQVPMFAPSVIREDIARYEVSKKSNQGEGDSPIKRVRRPQFGSYREPKESHAVWLTKIPSHWEMRRNGRLFTERRETGFPELPILEVSLRTGVQVREFEGSQRKQMMADIAGYKRARQGDIAYNMMRMWQGAVGVAPLDGLISPAYVVARPLPGTNARYFSYLFRTDDYMSEIDNASHGIVKDRNRLYWDDFKQIASPYPPPEEQDAIVRFLDHHGRLVNRFIRAKRRLIELLNEQKQAIIHQAVTRGLDPDVPLKPSGVDWLGDIPAHCQITKLGRVCVSIRDGTHNPPAAEEGVHRLLSVRNIVNGRFVTRSDDRTMKALAFAELQRSYTVECGDVVLALVGATTGKSAVVSAMENVTVQRSIGILRPNPQILDSEYLNFALGSELVQFQIRQVMIKYAAQPGIYLEMVGRLKIVFPELREQKLLVTRVKARTEGLDEAICKCTEEIKLVHEYRTRLIADIVTGKLDIRESANRLDCLGSIGNDEFDLIDATTIDTDDSILSDQDETYEGSRDGVHD